MRRFLVMITLVLLLLILAACSGSFSEKKVLKDAEAGIMKEIDNSMYAAQYKENFDSMGTEYITKEKSESNEYYNVDVKIIFTASDIFKSADEETKLNVMKSFADMFKKSLFSYKCSGDHNCNYMELVFKDGDEEHSMKILDTRKY